MEEKIYFNLFSIKQFEKNLKKFLKILMNIGVL
jgi:hypothetical protein